MLMLCFKRLVYAIFTLAFVACLVFTVTEALPGDFCTSYLGRNATDNNLALCRDNFGLSQPMLERFLAWSSHLAEGDFGLSLSSGRPVNDDLLPRLANTALLGGIAALLAIPLALLLGMVTAICRDSWLDNLVSSATLLAMTIPEFITATLLTLAFAIWLPWFPAITLADAHAGLEELLPNAWLPALTLALISTAHMMRMMRSSTIDVLSAGFIRMARIRRIPTASLLLRHVLPAAVLPTITLSAMTVAWLLGGVVIIEQVFNYPGIGTLMISAVYDRDIPVVQACALTLSAIYIACNLLADLSVALLNPRLR
ncbi:ABC transporter permease [Zobellella maritima]|uniref:ABC transporter permease n=1 Tax=Zobellella maritima TaxID=2059725 RepID=UPI000E300B90|nr:ABC transporter permease [Zobellella maritima]